MSSLTLSGWTQPSDALLGVEPGAAVFDYSAYASPEASFGGLAQFKDVKHVVAWSMGGQLALRAIAAGVLRPRHLTLIAAPYQFVSDAPTLKAMPRATFDQFRANYAADPKRTKGRFHALVAKGDRDAARVMGLLGHHPQVEDTARWLPWLDDLGRYSLAEVNFSDMPAMLLVHGTSDAIVPFSQSAALMETFPQAHLQRWDAVAHAPHLHDGEKLRAQIQAHRIASGVV